MIDRMSGKYKTRKNNKKNIYKRKGSPTRSLTRSPRKSLSRSPTRSLSRSPKRSYHKYESKKGSNLRQKLVTLCKKEELEEKRDWKEYDKVTQEIINDYIKGDKSFFIHLDKQIKTFKPETLRCLERSLTRLQEDAIPESMPHLYYILTHSNS